MTSALYDVTYQTLYVSFSYLHFSRRSFPSNGHGCLHITPPALASLSSLLLLLLRRHLGSPGSFLGLASLKDADELSKQSEIRLN